MCSVFVEANIDDLLARGSRVVQIADADEEGEEGAPTSISKLSFSKTQFHSSNADASLDMSDPDFWAKVLGQDSRETLVSRLKDGSAIEDEAARRDYLKELFELAQEVCVPFVCCLLFAVCCMLCGHGRGWGRAGVPLHCLAPTTDHAGTATAAPVLVSGALPLR